MLWLLGMAGLLGLGLAVCAPASATNYGCAEEGGASSWDCTTPIPSVWTYTGCDYAWSTAARQVAWCNAFGGTGSAVACSAPMAFSDANIASVSLAFEHIVHGCETPSESDSGWGQTVDAQPYCFSGSPASRSGVLVDDFRRLDFSGHSGGTCASTWSETVYAQRSRYLTCAPGYNPFFTGGGDNLCIRQPSCPCHLVGNPTRVSDGQKILWETDLPPVAGGLLQYRRVYRSYGRFRPYQLGAAPPLEEFWESNFDSRLYVLDATRYPVPYVVSTPEGTVRYFDASGAEYLHYGRAAERLSIQRDAAGQITGYMRTLSDDSAETFTADGLLSRYDDTQGHRITLAYDSGQHLASVTDERGRVLRFDYNAAGQRTALTLADGSRFVYAYDANGNLATVTYPGGAVRGYRYENASFPHALTGITDENGADFADYGYDSSGRVQDTRHAPALAGGAIEHLHFSYDTASATITEPLGNAVTYTFTSAGGVQNLATLSGPCGNCGESNAAIAYDAAGYLASTTDFNGTVTRYTYDDTRGLETSRVQAKGTQEQRTITTTPDSQWRKPAVRTVADGSGAVGRTLWQYNARGQVIARCESDPADAAALAYTCNRDSAPPAKVHRWTYRYCEAADIAAGSCPLAGLLISTDGPRTDVADVTSYSYYSTTDISGCATPGGTCHSLGDLKTVTDALGHVTTYLSYDTNGHVARIRDANGVYTDLAYHPRGRLLTRTVRGNADGTPNAALDAITTFGYDNAGNVTSVVQPDGASLNYSYDAAHRLTDIADRLGNRIHYALDAAGNRVDEQTLDSRGALKRQLSRTYDALNRLTQRLNSTSAAVQTYTNPVDQPTLSHGYDRNGNAIYSLDGNGVGTEQQFDPLNRMVTTLQDHAGTGITRDTATQYAYGARDNLRSVTDPDGLVTSYTYDGLNNLTNLSSPDTGNTAYTYDTAGNRATQTDARGIASAYSYDALNRLAGIHYSTPSLDITYAYDQPATGCYNSGRLTALFDHSGNTTYCYDRRGNVVKKTQLTFETASCGATDYGCPANVPNPTALSPAWLVTKYSYTVADRLAGITYPSGAVVTYGRDSAGRIVRVTYQAGATSAPISILSNVSYYPFGPANTLMFGDGRTLTKTYDTDYAIRSVASSAPDGLAINATIDVIGNLTRAANTIGATTQQYRYDPLDRLTEVDDASGSALLALTYGPTGDRLSKTQGDVTQAYAYLPGSHRLGSVADQTRRYDANGNTLTGPNGTLTYDDRNRLIGQNLIGATINSIDSTSVQFDYNGKSERVSKQTVQRANCDPACLTGTGWLTGTEAFAYDVAGHLIGEYPGRYGSGAKTEYVYLDGTPIAALRGGVLYYIETDQLGTPRQVIKPGATTASDATVWTWDYFASNSAFGENSPSVRTLTFNLRFPGQYYDSETGLSYNYFRDYEPSTGRYVESDPVGLKGAIDTYAYVDSRSLDATDRTGLRTDGQCCMASIALGQDGGDLGWPVCCDGRVVPCANPKSLGLDSDTGVGIARDCARRHERKHFPILLPCDCNTTGPVRLDARPGVDVKGDECQAYRDTKDCLMSKRSKCGFNRRCTSDVDYMIQQTDRQIGKYCGG